jgi:hypothetical protein
MDGRRRSNMAKHKCVVCGKDHGKNAKKKHLKYCKKHDFWHEGEKCPRHVLAAQFGPKRGPLLSVLPKCECGCCHEAQVMHEDLYDHKKTFLCKNCEVRYVTISLKSDQFFSLLKNKHTTKEFMLHSDFYDEDSGEALQPMI